METFGGFLSFSLSLSLPPTLPLFGVQRPFQRLITDPAKSCPEADFFLLKLKFLTFFWRSHFGTIKLLICELI